MENSQSQADLIIERMQVPDEPGLFILGCFERPATVYMQQVRALNLIYALDQKPRETNNKTMLVIGAGAGGITAAAAAAALKWDVTILEKMPDVLSLADGASTHRWLHPHVYDWPAEGAEEARTHLGILDWSADSSRAVADQLRGEWRRLEHAYKIGTHVGISDVTLGQLSNGQWLVRWNGAGPRPAGENKPPAGCRPIKKLQQCVANVVILAVGFGQEKPLPPEFPDIHSYWHNDHIDVLKTNDTYPPAALISGTGDGGLIDALRYSYKDFRHERVLQKLRVEWLGENLYQDVKVELLGIENKVQEMAREGHPHEAELNRRYYDLIQGLEAERTRIDFRDDVTVFLAGRDKYPLSLRAAPINRFLFTLTNTQYRQGEVIGAREISDGKWDVVFKGRDIEHFSDVVIRHGPVPELPQLFPAIFEKVNKFRASLGKELLAARDPTRDPLYDKTFKASLAASARAVGMPLVASSGSLAFSVANATPSVDPPDDYRLLLAAAFGSTSVDIAGPSVDSLVAFALKRNTNGDFTEQVRLLVSPPGGGKTELLKNVAMQVLDDPVKIPLILQMRSFDACLEKSLFVNAIEAAVEPLAHDEERRAHLRAGLLDAAMQGKLVLLLDGLDEMPPPGREALLEALRGSGSDLRRGNCVVLASRPLGAETEGIPAVQLRVHGATLQRTRSMLEGLRSGSIKGSLPDQFFVLLGNAALKSLCGENVAADLAAAVGGTGLDLVNVHHVARWLIRRRDDMQGWEFAHQGIQDLLAAMALARDGDLRKIAGLAYGERFAYSAALPMALALAGDASSTHALLEKLQDTLDWRILMLRLEVAKFNSSLPPNAALSLARAIARVVAKPELATIQFVITLAEACRGIPSALASLLSYEVSNAFREQENPELYRAVRFLSRAELPDAAEKMQAWLMHENEIIADGAAEALGELRQEDAIPALVSAYLMSTKSIIFRRAVEAIATIGGEQATNALLGILSNRNLYHNFRWPAAEALGVLTSERAFDALLAEAGDPSATVRRNIAEALGSYPGRRTVDQLVRMAKDTDDGVRVDVFKSLARRAEACDIAVLHSGLDDSHLTVRLAAADGLIRLDRLGLLKSLEPALSQAGMPWRELAAVLLTRVLGPSASPTLVQLSKEADRYARLGAAHGLAGIEDEAALAALVRLAGDDDETVRSAAIDSLPLLNRSDVIDAIAQNLESEELTITALAAARKLRGFRDHRVADALRRAVLRPDYAGTLAASALGTIGETGDIDLIVAAWHAAASGYPISTDVYAKAIAQIGGERACKSLRLFLDHSNVIWRLHALRALGQVPEANAVLAILHACTDSDKGIRREAANVLQPVGYARLQKGLTLALHSDSAFVQSTAARLGVAYADQEMIDAMLEVDSTAWGEDGAAVYSLVLAGMKEVADLRQAAEALACPP